MLTELSTKEISEANNPQTMPEHQEVAKHGDSVAKEERLKLEAETGKADLAISYIASLYAIEKNQRFRAERTLQNTPDGAG